MSDPVSVPPESDERRTEVEEVAQERDEYRRACERSVGREWAKVKNAQLEAERDRYRDTLTTLVALKEAKCKPRTREEDLAYAGRAVRYLVGGGYAAAEEGAGARTGGCGARDDPEGRWEHCRGDDAVRGHDPCGGVHGLQAGRLVGLKRRDVDLEAGRMTVTEKGGKTREVVLGGPAWAAMDRQMLRSRLHIDGRLWMWDAKRVQIMWREVRGEFPHGFHSLRHYAATWLRSLGLDPLDISTQLGHVGRDGKPYVQVFERVYDHHVDTEGALARIAAAL